MGLVFLNHFFGGYLFCLKCQICVDDRNIYDKMPNGNPTIAYEAVGFYCPFLFADKQY